MAGGLERILCGTLVNRTPGKHGSAHWPSRYIENTYILLFLKYPCCIKKKYIIGVLAWVFRSLKDKNEMAYCENGAKRHNIQSSKSDI